ncbi:MAG: glutaminase [Burkholderiales bacterium RIFCSPLOWO2_12_67_14]|nr:MAG: glutaminase [Burkholderiales bacterium RIFCSPLOWO2_02_FULL_67_64]OGB35694.1 MAG: glutaminase [Burkholderiales bacterium RIFCSPHIGHO2_12_FULL_67_38]OGB46603.1 MAG: glutaminase [Burkholderiales bacterium RIFCSPLOWO2_12_67_14]OGC01904.1 MAG: glutaminase [Burkholderiales bacterium RIFCSPLOWO2_12_FULL_67_210]
MPSRHLPAILDQIHTEAQPLFGQGHVADYIPALGEVPPRQFGMAVALCSGETHAVGDAHTPFSLQSITKLFTFVLALKLVGDELWQRVGREPSGAAFNSIVQLETENGIPRNPFINAGALVITDILTTRYAHLDYALLGALRRLADDPGLHWNARIAKSERDTAHRNMAMAYFMKSHGNFHNPPELVLDNYCRQCATEMSCAQLAQATMFLANGGRDLGHQGQPDEQFLSANDTRRVNALLLTCGAYDAAGDFAYRIGLPVKTGVGGGIVAIVPGVGTVAVWAPELDAKGNSVLGAFALERLVQLTGWGHNTL